MNRKVFIVAAAAWGLIVVDTLSAQPILNRVEQLLREQLGNSAAKTSPPAEPGYLGIIADDTKEEGRGVRVLSVVPAGPAAKGGLQTNDLITKINVQPIGVMDDMARVMQQSPEGTKFNFTVNREGQERQLEVTLGRRPAAPPTAPASADLPAPGPAPPDLFSNVPPGPKLGVRTVPVTEEVRQRSGLPVAAGAQVVDVTPGLPADVAGVRAGAIITGFNGRVVATPQDLAAAVKAAIATPGEVELKYFNGGQEFVSRVQLAPAVPSTDAPKLQLRGKPAVPPPPRPDSSVTDNADARTKALEDRIRELEARLEKLEAGLKAKTE